MPSFKVNTEKHHVVLLPEGTERRQHPRWRVACTVQELEPEWHILSASSLSAGGLFCPDAAPRPEGEELKLEIDVGHGDAVVANATVVHNGRGKEGLGLGLKFVRAQPRLELALDRIYGRSRRVGS